VLDGQSLLDGFVFRRQAEDIGTCRQSDIVDVDFVTALILHGPHEHGLKGVRNTIPPQDDVECHSCPERKAVLDKHGAAGLMGYAHGHRDRFGRARWR